MRDDTLAILVCVLEVNKRGWNWHLWYLSHLLWGINHHPSDAFILWFLFALCLQLFSTIRICWAFAHIVKIKTFPASWRKIKINDCKIHSKFKNRLQQTVLKFVFGFIGREILVEDGFPDVEIICGADVNANTLVQIMILVAVVRQWRPNGCGGLVRWV